MAVGFAVNGLVALLQSTTGMFTDWTFLGAAREENRQTIGGGEILRASGFLGTSNGLGWYLVTFLPVPISLLVLKVEDFRGWKRCLLAVSSVWGVMPLLLLSTRGGWVPFGVGLLPRVRL